MKIKIRIFFERFRDYKQTLKSLSKDLIRKIFESYKNIMIYSKTLIIYLTKSNPHKFFIEILFEMMVHFSRRYSLHFLRCISPSITYF